MRLTRIADGRSDHFLDAGLALLAALALLALHAVGGFSTLTNAGTDNDSLLRLVQIRDLLGGQGWYDLHQYRMGMEGGLPMHWSRLVDAPIAAIMLAASAITGNAALAETIALVLWPTLLLAAAVFFLLRAARSLSGEEALFPALVLGAAGLHFIGIFAPGALDHHNLQLALTLALLSLLLAAPRRSGAACGAASGAIAALLLAIAMEGAPFAAIGGVVVALWFAFQPKPARRAAMFFGLAFAGVSAAIFLATVPASTWALASCDAFSIPQLAVAAVAGTGLAAIAASRAAHGSIATRLMLLAGLAGLIGLGMLILFPQCLADPYAGLDLRLRDWWLSGVTEAQPLWNILAIDPAMAAGHYATPLAGILCLAASLRRGSDRRHIIALAFLGTAFLVSVWQVRGSTFAIALSVVPLAAFVGKWRGRVGAGSPASASARMLLAWLISFNVTWSAAAAGVSGLLQEADGKPGGETIRAAGSCHEAADFDRLAGLPASTVLVVSNLGAPVLRHTHHKVLAGPYHRNGDGNLAVIDAFSGPPQVAWEIAMREGVGLVAVCRGNDETELFLRRAPDGVLALLTRGQTPDWLEIIPQSEGMPLEIYRVAPLSNEPGEPSL